jgi:hypothetical protein
MEEILVTPRGVDGSPVGNLAGFLVCAWNRAETYDATLICLAEFVKLAGSGGDLRGPGELSAASMGSKLMETFAALASSLGADVVKKIRTEIHDLRAADSPRRRGTIFGAAVKALADTPPLTAPVSSPQAERITMLQRQAEVAGQKGPRATGGAGIFGGAPLGPVGSQAGAFGILVPVCSPNATQIDVIKHMGGEGIVAELRAWAAVRADTGTTFNLLSPQSIVYAEADFEAIKARALGPEAEREPIIVPATWDESVGLFQRIVTTALTNEARGTPLDTAGTHAPLPGAKFRPPRGSVVELTKATEGPKMAIAVAAQVVMPLGRPEVILSTHARALELEKQASEQRPSDYTLARQLVDDKELGKCYRGLFISNLHYTGEMPEKGEIAILGVTVKAGLSAALRLDIEKGLGNVLAEAQQANVTKLVVQVASFKVTLELCTQLLGASPSLDDEIGTEGRLGETKGPTAAADIERAVLRLAELWKGYGGLVLGIDVSTPHFAMPTLVQQCRELTDAGRIDVIQHALDAVAREGSAMRRDPNAALLDITGAFIQARVGKLMRTRTIEEARAAGKAAAREQAAAQGGKRAASPSVSGELSPKPKRASHAAAASPCTTCTAHTPPVTAKPQPAP